MALYYTQDGSPVDATAAQAAANGWTTSSPFGMSLASDPSAGWGGQTAQQFYDAQHGAGSYDAAVQKFTQLAQAGQLGEYEQIYGKFPIGDPAAIDAWMKNAFVGGAETVGNQDAAAVAGDFIESGKLAKLIIAGAAGGAAGEVLGTGSLLPTDAAPTTTAAVDPATSTFADAGTTATDATVADYLDPNAVNWTDTYTPPTEGAGGIDLAKLATTGAIGAGATAVTGALTGSGEGDAGGQGFQGLGTDEAALTGTLGGTDLTNPAELPGIETSGADSGAVFESPGFQQWLKDTTGLTPADLLKAGGAIIPAVLGAYGASQQSKNLNNLANQFASYGAPYRSKLADLYANPGGYLSSPEVQIPVQQGTDAAARAVSAKGGNPFGNPGAMSEIQNYASNQLYGRLGQEKDRLAGFGGLTAYNQAAPGALTNAANSSGGVLNALAYGAQNLFNPQPTLADLFKQNNIFTYSGGK